MKPIKLLSILIIGLASMAAATPSSSADKVSFALNWVPYGLHLGPYVAEAKGFYEENGIEIEIFRGFGSGDTTKRVGTGGADFGMADASSVIIGYSKGLPVKMVAMVLDKSSDAIYYLKDSGIESVKDLPGRTLGAAAGEASLNLMSAFGQGAGIDVSKIKVVNMTPPAKIPSLIAGSVDSIVTFVTEEPTILEAAKAAGKSIGKFMFADFGVDRYAMTILANDSLIETNPDLVKRVLDATMRGYAWARDNPAEAVELFAKKFPESSSELVASQFEITLDLMITDLAKAHGLGYIDEEKMAKTIDLIGSFTTFEKDVKPEDVYTISYLPKIPASGK
ncbi:ABC transporter substrate-binding protein [Mesorhizobium camelthorni]|uniref:ABC transporter substrate-binding protein n=2 Tax=Allomesorhizobium camelthorni TaxID=475069 RepID=A0A6G4WH92_9HYPH|nr:ABC transporter substrate-binding protein [Mesorhizobium camelthorni]